MGYKQSGFTIIEITIGLAIIGFIALMIASIYLANFRLFSNQNISFDVTTQNDLATDTITNQVRESQEVTASCCSGENTNASVLILQLWPIDASGEPIDPGGTNYDYIIFKLDPTNITNLTKRVIPAAVSTRPASTKIVATSVTDLQFKYDDDASPATTTQVTVSITTTGTANAKTQTITRTSMGTLRNK